MANKRMFSMKIVDSDAFLDLPLSTQCLYFHLNMRADDDGFVDNAKRIMRIIGSSNDDLKLLIAKRFLLVFEDGVIVIKHWRMHNTLSSSRYHETQYLDEKSMLKLKENGSYSFADGQEIDDKKLVKMSKRQCRRTIDEQVENADIDLDIGLDIDKELDKDIGLDKDIDLIKDIVDFLNQKCDTHFRFSTKKTQQLIKARLKDGFTVDDFKTVIDNKCEDWLSDNEMCKFLRPETLFGNKFEGYLNQKQEPKTNFKPTSNRMAQLHELYEEVSSKELNEYQID